MSCDLTNGRLLDECLLGRSGIKTLYFTKFNDFDSLTGVVESGGEITSLGTDPITIYQFDMQDNVGSFEEVPNSTPENGTIFLTQNVTLTLFYVKPADLANLNNLKRGRWTIWALDFQGKIRLFGRTRGCVASGGSDVSGAAPGDKKGLDLVLTAAEQDYAPFMADYTTVPFDNFANVTVVTTNDFNAQYQAVYNAMTIKPSESVANAQNLFVESLMTAGIWLKLDALWLLANNNEANSYLNFLNPGTFDITNLNVGGMTFTALEGWISSGAPLSVLNLNYNPTTDAINVTQTSFSFGAYSRTNGQMDQPIMGSRIGGPDDETILYLRDSSNLLDVKICQDVSTIATLANSSSLGLHSGTRTGTTNKAHKESSHGVGQSVATGGFANLDMYACGYNNNGTPSFDTVHQVSLLYIGAYLSDSELESFASAIEVYMDSNGKGVIP